MKRTMFTALAVAIVGVIVLAIQLAIDPRRAALAYTGAFGFGVTTAVGSLLLVTINHTARSTWYVVLRRVSEAAAATLPLYAILFVPVAFAVPAIYPWAHPERFEASVRDVYEHGHAWFRPGFFIARSYLYLVVWSAVAWVLRRQSIAQDEDGRVARTNVQRWVSSASMPVMAITLTFAAFDWFMSIVPGWFSTMHGLYVFAAGFSGAVGLTCVGAFMAQRAHLLANEVRPAHFLAIGRVLLVAIILWAYIAFCTLLLIWIGNMPREVTLYTQRTTGGWTVFSAMLLFGHFIFPFLMLLSRDVKKDAAKLAWVGGFTLLMHAVDAYWLIVPSQNDMPSILDVGAFLAVGGVVFAFGTWRFSVARPIPIGDPNLALSLSYESY